MVAGELICTVVSFIVCWVLKNVFWHFRDKTRSRFAYYVVSILYVIINLCMALIFLGLYQEHTGCLFALVFIILQCVCGLFETSLNHAYLTYGEIALYWGLPIGYLILLSLGVVPDIDLVTYGIYIVGFIAILQVSIFSAIELRSKIGVLGILVLSVILAGLCFTTKEDSSSAANVLGGVIIFSLLPALFHKNLGGFYKHQLSSASGSNLTESGQSSYVKETKSSYGSNDSYNNQSSYVPEQRTIAFAVQNGSAVCAYDAKNNLLVSRCGELDGYTSTTVSVYTPTNHLVSVYDVNNKFVTSRVVYK